MPKVPRCVGPVCSISPANPASPEGERSLPVASATGIMAKCLRAQRATLASDLYANNRFRCWPLNPCAHPADPGLLTGNSEMKPGPKYFDLLPQSVRVSLSQVHGIGLVSKKTANGFSKKTMPAACKCDRRTLSMRFPFLMKNTA